MNKDKFNGFHIEIYYDPEDKIYIGKLMGVRDMVLFHCDTFSELEGIAEEAITDYLEM